MQTTMTGDVRTRGGRHGGRRARSTRRRRTALMVALALLAGCGDTDARDGDAGANARDADTASPAAPNASDSQHARVTPDPGQAGVRIHFSRGDSAVAVQRAVASDSVSLETSLRLLLRGPTAAERSAGIRSWFSDTTAGALRSVAVAEDGSAVVDFADLRMLIPNASSSAGSAMLLRELDATVFEHPEVSSVEYRIEGSCPAFWEWLQYGCRVVRRP